MLSMEFQTWVKTSEYWVFIFLTNLADGWEVMFAVYFLNISICEDVVQNMVFLQMSKTMPEEYKNAFCNMKELQKLEGHYWLKICPMLLLI